MLLVLNLSGGAGWKQLFEKTHVTICLSFTVSSLCTADERTSVSKCPVLTAYNSFMLWE